MIIFGIHLDSSQFRSSLENVYLMFFFTSCPQLKGIFTNVGTRPLDPHSALFSFSNLTSFSLIARHGLGDPGKRFNNISFFPNLIILYPALFQEFFPALEEMPPKFWDMLLNRCPDLQELAICSFSLARVFNFERITEGRWPKLHTLTLGSFVYHNDFTQLGPPGLTHASANGPTLSLGQFLDLHPALKYIRFLWNFKPFMSPLTIPLYYSSSTTTSTTLPNLDTFIGVYQQLNHIAHPETIETLDLTCEPVYADRLNTVVPILKKLSGMTSLDIWIDVVDIMGGTHGMGFFKSVLEACPGLVDFHFMCTTSFTVVRVASFTMVSS